MVPAAVTPPPPLGTEDGSFRFGSSAAPPPPRSLPRSRALAVRATSSGVPRSLAGPEPPPPPPPSPSPPPPPPVAASEVPDRSVSLYEKLRGRARIPVRNGLTTYDSSATSADTEEPRPTEGAACGVACCGARSATSMAASRPRRLLWCWRSVRLRSSLYLTEEEEER